MTLSALGAAANGDRLERSLELYREMSVALSGAIARVKAGTAGTGESKALEDALKAHCRALNTVLEAEASLVKRSTAGVVGKSGELDLEAARAEILARLARWAAEG